MEFVLHSDWDRLPESANQLFEQGSIDSIFFSRPWFENLASTALLDNQSMQLACVIDQASVMAILPLLENDDGQLSPLTHLYSSLYTLLIRDERQDETLNCLISGINQLPLETLKFSPVAEHDPRLESLGMALKSRGYECHQNFRFYNWIHRVNGESFEDYFDSRPSKVRNTILRKKRKLLREHDVDLRLYVDQDIDKALADYQSVYQASWKAKELFDGFIEGLADKLSHQRWLRLGILYIDGQPAAAQFWFVVHKKASIFKLAYDEQWKQYSPGSILIHHLMEHVINTDKVDEIDFLTGNDRYKQDWMTERRERFAVYFGKPQQPDNLLRRFTKLFNRNH